MLYQPPEGKQQQLSVFSWVGAGKMPPVVERLRARLALAHAVLEQQPRRESKSLLRHGDLLRIVVGCGGDGGGAGGARAEIVLRFVDAALHEFRCVLRRL